MIKVMCSELIPLRIKKQIANRPVSQVAVRIFEVIEDVPQERVSERIAKQNADVPVPHVVKETLEVVKMVLCAKYAARLRCAAHRGEGA